MAAALQRLFSFALTQGSPLSADASSQISRARQHGPRSRCQEPLTRLGLKTLKTSFSLCLGSRFSDHTHPGTGAESAEKSEANNDATRVRALQRSGHFPGTKTPQDGSYWKRDTWQIQQGIMLEGLRIPSGLGTPLDPPRRTWNTLQGKRGSRCLPEPNPETDERRTKAG